MIDRIKGHIRDDETFRWPVVRSSNHEKGFVLVSGKKDESQLMYNPLVLRCAGKVVRYVAISSSKEDNLGKRYPVGGGTGLTLHAVRPGQVTISKHWLNGHMVIDRVPLRQETVHPVEPSNIPAFVQQPGPPTLENAYGAMDNGLIGR